MRSIGHHSLRPIVLVVWLAFMTGLAEAASRKAPSVQLDPDRPLFITGSSSWAEDISSGLLRAQYPGAVLFAPEDALIPTNGQRLNVTPLPIFGNRESNPYSTSPTYEVALTATYISGDGAAPIDLGSFRSKIVHSGGRSDMSGGRSDVSRLETEATKRVIRDLVSRVWKRPKAEKPANKSGQE